MTQPFLCSFRSCCSLGGRRGSTTGAWGGPGAGAGSSLRGDRPLPAGTHLILGGGVPGDHAAKIVGVHAVNIPRVEFDGGNAFNLQGNRGGESNAPIVIARSPARIVSAALALVDATIFLGTTGGPNF